MLGQDKTLYDDNTWSYTRAVMATTLCNISGTLAIRQTADEREIRKYLVGDCLSSKFHKEWWSLMWG